MKVLRTRLSSQAKLEASDAYDWYLDSSLSAANGFVDDLEKVTRLIKAFPEGGRLLEDNRRVYLMSRYPYLVVYRVRRSVGYITAVAHAQRGPHYWTGIKKRTAK